MWWADRRSEKGQSPQRAANDVARHAGDWCGAVSGLGTGYQSVGSNDLGGGAAAGFDRVMVTVELFLGIPALVAAGLLEMLTASKHIAGGAGWAATGLCDNRVVCSRLHCDIMVAQVCGAE